MSPLTPLSLSLYEMEGLLVPAWGVGGKKEKKKNEKESNLYCDRISFFFLILSFFLSMHWDLRRGPVSFRGIFSACYSTLPSLGRDAP